MTLVNQNPERAIWWAKMEHESQDFCEKPSGRVFRQDRPSYAEMMKFAQTQTDFFGNDETIACFCGD